MRHQLPAEPSEGMPSGRAAKGRFPAAWLPTWDLVAGPAGPVLPGGAYQACWCLLGCAV